MIDTLFSGEKISLIRTPTFTGSKLELSWKGSGDYLGRLEVYLKPLAVSIALDIEEHCENEEDAQALFEAWCEQSGVESSYMC